MNTNASGIPLDHRRQRQRRIAHEALVVEQDLHDVVVTRDEPDHRLAVDPRLAEDGILGSHAGEGLVGLGPEAVAVEVVLPRRGHRGHLARRRPVAQGSPSPT
jgi:hypothetical protein